MKSSRKELEQLLEEFSAARAAEALACKRVDSTLESQCKDMDVVHKATVEMLQAHNRAMNAYLRLLQHKLHGPPTDQRT